MPDDRGSELILALGYYAYVLDKTKGLVNTLVGPTKTSLSTSDQLVVYDAKTQRFNECRNQSDAIQTNILVPKNSYVILRNPTKNGQQPEPEKQGQIMPINQIRMGESVNLPGPQSFPLWPTQVAMVVPGHRLRSNEYLLVRVNDDEAARANWESSIVKTANTNDGQNSEAKDDKKATTKSAFGIDKEKLVPGQILVVKGTEIAFYVPPTGIEVLADNSNEFVRKAETLERLEYSILLDENGNKEYVQGPAVVFPTPTQQFFIKEGQRKFRAFELQPKTSIHLKVIADYTDEATKKTYKAGQEIHLTGEDSPIYFPQAHHAIISYGGQEKSFATTIPSGEGIYVLNRTNGDIKTVEGPEMFLPNPIDEVVVRRVLTAKQCDLWYPGNAEVRRINDELRGTPPDPAGRNRGGASLESMSANYFAAAASAPLEDSRQITRSFTTNYDENDRPLAAARMKGVVADALNRGTTYTPPRSILLNTNQYSGAVKINVWTSYAVRVVNSKGEARTVLGPQTLLLDYDETLEPLSLSKGKPKSADNRIDTAYLRYENNTVSDIISARTNDYVDVQIPVKYLVRFDKAKQDDWFSIQNYVQYMVDHLRSLVVNVVRSMDIQTFNDNAITVVRDTILGTKGADGVRPLHRFDENGMIVYEAEILGGITITDTTIAKLLADSRKERLTDAIDLARQQQKLVLTQGQQAAKRQIAEELATTEALQDKLNQDSIDRAHSSKQAEVEAENRLNVLRKNAEQEVAEIAKVTSALYLETKKAQSDHDQTLLEADLQRRVTQLAKEAEASSERMRAVTPGLVEALVGAANAGILEKVTPQLAALAFVNGQDTEQLLTTLFKGTGAEGILDNLKRLARTRANQAA